MSGRLPSSSQSWPPTAARRSAPAIARRRSALTTTASVASPITASSSPCTTSTRFSKASSRRSPLRCRRTRSAVACRPRRTSDLAGTNSREDNLSEMPPSPVGPLARGTSVRDALDGAVTAIARRRLRNAAAGCRTVARAALGSSARASLHRRRAECRRSGCAHLPGLRAAPLCTARAGRLHPRQTSLPSGSSSQSIPGR